MYNTRSQQDVKRRQDVERKIVTQVIQSAIGAGYQLSVNNGDDAETPKTDSVDVCLAAMFATDEDMLIVHKGGKRFGWVHFVYGNDGYDVMSDYTCNLEDNGTLKPAIALADSLEAA